MQSKQRYPLVVLLAGVFMGGQSVHAQPDPYQFTPPQFADPAPEPAPVQQLTRILISKPGGPFPMVDPALPAARDTRRLLVAQGQVAAATVATAQKQWEQAGEQFKLGVATQDEVDQAEAALIETQIRFAQEQAQPTDTTEKQITGYLEKLVTTREHQVAVAEARYKAAAVTLTDLNASRIRLSEARIRLELHRLVALRAESLAATTARYQAGVVTRTEVEQASAALRAAHNLTKSVEQTVVGNAAGNQEELPVLELQADEIIIGDQAQKAAEPVKP